MSLYGRGDKSKMRSINLVVGAESRRVGIENHDDETLYCRDK